jgi:uncharacterized protein (UPF0548 family)
VTVTYPEVGATQTGELPAGYRHIRRRLEVPDLARVAAGMRAWGIHRGAGLAVRVGGEPAVGLAFQSGAGIGPFRLWVPCEVVWVLDEPDAYGYGFGTLPGHPEHGEEAFLVSRDAGGRSWFEVRAFSRAATWYARLGGPATHLFQDWVTDRYVSAARRLA